MRFQAFIEQLGEQIAVLRIAGQVYQLPRTCLPNEAEEADVLDVVVFVNEKETDRRLSLMRKWLVSCGALRAMELDLSGTLEDVK